MSKAKGGSVEARLLRSMGQAVEIATGKATAVRVYDLPLTAKEAKVAAAPAYNPKDVIAIRNGLRLSQALFAQALNVSPGTVRSWEQGEKPPQGPSRRLLEIAARSPETILQGVVVKRPLAPREVSNNRGTKRAVERRSGFDRRDSGGHSLRRK